MMKKTLTKIDIARKLSETPGIDLQESKNYTNTLIKLISKSLKNDNRLLISNFGSFICADTNERLGRNPRTGKKYIIIPRKIIKFRLSKHFKKKLNRFDNICAACILEKNSEFFNMIDFSKPDEESLSFTDIENKTK